MISTQDVLDALDIAYPDQKIDTSVVYNLPYEEKEDLYHYILNLPLGVAPVDIAALLSVIFI
jgi:hypothetical protein